MKQMLGVLGWLVAFAALADAPFVDWVQHPVGPGDTVLLQGGNWGTNAVVEIGGRTVKPVYQSGSGLAFAYPSDKTEVLKGRIVSENGESNEFSVNEPTVWWLQGDGGDIATPGGWLRAFGRSLAGGKLKVRSKSEEGRSVELPLTRVDDYELAAKVPTDLACGEYEVFVKSAISDWMKAGTWTVAPPRKIWKDTVFDITSFGAIADDGLSDTAAVSNALASAAANGGGIVQIPIGSFDVSGTFEIPPHTLIRGVSKELSHLKWPDTMDPPEYMLIGDHSFGIHDLFISVGQYRHGLTYKGNTSRSFWASDKPKTHDISLKNLTLRFVTDQQRDRDKKVFLERFTMKGKPINLPDALRVEMVNVDLYCDKCPTDSQYFNLTGWYHRIANCSFRGGAWAGTPGVNFIFEDNFISSGCMSINPMCNGAYYARNTFRDVYRGDPVCIGHDSSRTAFGRCNTVRGKVKGEGEEGKVIELTFANPSDNPANKAKTLKDKMTACERNKTWIGTSCTIIKGHGVGQSRKIAAIADDWSEVTLEEPFGVAPDETSVLYVSYERQHVLILDNSFTDVGKAVELYGGANEYVIARNRLTRAGTLKAQGFMYSGIIPTWRISYLDNVVEEGSGERSDTDILACGEYSLACVARGNVLKSNAGIEFNCQDGIVEHNDIRHSSWGIRGGSYIGDNRFADVMHPLCQASGTWSAAAEAAHEQWRQELVRKLRAQDGTVMNEQAFRRIFGASVSFSLNRQTIQDILAGKKWPKGLSLPIHFGFNPRVPEIASVEVSAEGAGGWTYGKPAKMSFQKGRPGKIEASFFGCLQAKTSGEKTGYFTVPLRFKIVGKDGWKLETVLTTPIASTGYENRVTEWRYAIVPGAELPKDLSELDWHPAVRRGKDGIDCTVLDCAKDPLFFGNYKDSLVLESRFEVKRPVTIGFCRSDIPGVFSLDGEILHRGGAWYNTYVTRLVQPGVHVIRNFRPRGGWMMGYRAKDFCCYFSHPKGANPGDYVFLPAEEDFSSFRKADFAPSAPLAAFDNPEFEDQAKFGTVDRHLKLGPALGFNGTAGGRLWARDKLVYYPFPTKFRLESGKKYRFSYAAKAHAWGATTVEWELVRNGQKIDAALGPTSEDLGGGWTKRELVIAPKTPQQEGDESRILIIATQRGRENVSDPNENYVDIDNFVLREDVPDWYVAHCWPTHNKVYNDNGRVRLCSFFKGAYVPKDADPVYVVTLLDKDGQPLASRRTSGIREGAFTLDFGRLVYEGAAKLVVSLYDRKNKLNAGSRTIDVTVTPTFRPGKNEIHVDEQGVSWLNGKRFMPLGFYAKFADKTLYPDLESELKKFSGMGFNCVIDYKTELLKTKEDRDRYYGLMDKYGIKVFPVDFMGDGCANEERWKARASGVEARAKELAKYPAVLGWYTLDEAGEDKIPLLVRTRQALNHVSPGKVTLPCNILDPEPFACVGDVQSGDIYPIGRDENLLNMDRYTARAAACRPAASWQAPQMYNWITQNRVAVTNEALWRAGGREPKEDEALSVALLFAAHGVNGFIFYSWYDIPRCPIPSVVDERWRIAGVLAKELKALEPYITSGNGVEALPHKDLKGSHRLVALTDPKGHKAVLVIGLEGDNVTEFTLPESFGQLKSQCGKTSFENGKWTFKGKEFSCDILR